MSRSKPEAVGLHYCGTDVLWDKTRTWQEVSEGGDQDVARPSIMASEHFEVLPADESLIIALKKAFANVL